jgi:hypothetical protein
VKKRQRVDPGLSPQIIGGCRRTLSPGAASLLPKMSGKRFLWLCSTRKRASSPRNAVRFAAATCDGVPQTRHRAFRAKIGAKPPLNRNPEYVTILWITLGMTRITPYCKSCFSEYGRRKSAISQIRRHTGPYLDVTRSLRAGPDLRRRSSHAFAIRCRRTARGTISRVGYANHGSILPDGWLARKRESSKAGSKAIGYLFTGSPY